MGKVKIIFASILLGGILSAVSIYIEAKYFLADTNVDNDSDFLLWFVMQTIFFTALIAIAFLTFNYIKAMRREKTSMKLIEKLGLLLQIIMVLTVLLLTVNFSIPVLYLSAIAKVFLIECITLFIMGVMLFIKTRNELALSFIIWAVGIFSLMYLV